MRRPQLSTQDSRPPIWARSYHPVYGECCSSNPRSMPMIFNKLATYNTRVSEGVVHTDEYHEAMRELQSQFDMWVKELNA